MTDWLVYKDRQRQAVDDVDLVTFYPQGHSFLYFRNNGGKTERHLRRKLLAKFETARRLLLTNLLISIGSLTLTLL